MMRLARWLVPALLLASAGCKKDASDDKVAAKTVSTEDQGPGDADKAKDKEKEKAPPPVRPAVEPVKPPLDLKAPPADAEKLPSGISFKRLATTDGATPGKNDTVMIQFTGWKADSGVTFNTTRTRNAPVPLDLSTATSGFEEVLPQVKKGEKVVMWVPPDVVSKSGGQPTKEALVFEVELVDIKPAPPVPPDVALPPAAAKTTPRGVKYTVVAPGTGATKARSFDTAAFHYTAWDANGKMISSSHKHKRPVTSPLHRQPMPFQEVATTMVVGQKNRFWVASEKLKGGSLGKLPEGQVCVEMELSSVTPAKKAPPPTPRDVAAPPADAKKTASGVAYKILKAGKGGTKPQATDSVSVNYTGWTTDGRMFDSSVLNDRPAEFSLSGVIKGWTDGLQVLSVGDTARFWIPEALAYKGAPGQPQGMLVFDIELLSVKPAPPPQDDGHGHGGHGGGDEGDGGEEIIGAENQLGGEGGPDHGPDDGHGH